MTPRLPHDPDAITCAEASAILGRPERTVARYRREGLLVESWGGLRLYSRFEALRFLENPWPNGRQAAGILGISHNRVSQLAAAERIPAHLTRSGKRVYRKSQIEVVANARNAGPTLPAFDAATRLRVISKVGD